MKLRIRKRRRIASSTGQGMIGNAKRKEKACTQKKKGMKEIIRSFASLWEKIRRGGNKYGVEKGRVGYRARVPTTSTRRQLREGE